MAKRAYLLDQIADEHGEPLDTLIPRLLAEMQTQKAVADHLGISQATLSTWLSTNGFTAKVVYVKSTTGEHANVNEIGS